MCGLQCLQWIQSHLVAALQSRLMEPHWPGAASSGTHSPFADVPEERTLQRLQGATKCVGMGMTRFISAPAHWSEQVMWLQPSARGLGTRIWHTLLVSATHSVRLCHRGPEAVPYGPPHFRTSFMEAVFSARLEAFFPSGMR